MSANHTPGPWELHRESDGALELNPAQWLGAPNKSRSALIARISPWDGDERFTDEAAANARLIAAAPELFAALVGLQAILEAAESNASGNPEWVWVSSRINAARRAVSKAEGRS